VVEIIPNWHPLVVHFTVALWITSFVFYLLAIFSGDSEHKQQWATVARWNLWSGFAFTLLTLLAGWDAYNTVNHDTESHAAMTVHRNWALITTGLFLLLTIWSYRNSRNSKNEGGLFVVIMLVATLLLSSTAWRGGELVYRHGMGVMSLPDNGEHDHGAHGVEGGHGDTGSEHGHGDTGRARDSIDEAHAHDNSDGHHDTEKKAGDDHNSDGHKH